MGYGADVGGAVSTVKKSRYLGSDAISHAGKGSLPIREVGSRVR